MRTRNPVTIVSWSLNAKEMYQEIAEFLRLKVADAGETGQKLCAVFDVDDTLFCKHPQLDNVIARHPLGWHLYNFCNRNGIAIRIVTARSGSPFSRKYLMNQLRLAGYTNPPDETQDGKVFLIGDGNYRGSREVKVFMEPQKHAMSGDSNHTAIAKREVRDLLTAGGERVVLCVGDQITDHVRPTPKLAAYLDQRFEPHTYYAFLNPRYKANLCVKTPEVYKGWPSPKQTEALLNEAAGKFDRSHSNVVHVHVGPVVETEEEETH